VINVDDIALKYNDSRSKSQKFLFKDFSFSSKPGEFTCLVGPSGCGKSTLLNLMAGFIRPSAGEIFVKDKKVLRPDINRTMVFQEYALFPWLNVIENVAFGLDYLITDKNERFVLAAKYLKMVGLLEHAKDRVSHLSGGMKQRVAIARALAVKPDLLLMDEPFGALDERTRTEMHRNLLSIWQELKTNIIFVTHSVDEALLLADRIIVIVKDPVSGLAQIKADIAISEPRLRNLADLSKYRQQIEAELYFCYN